MNKDDWVEPVGDPSYQYFSVRLGLVNESDCTEPLTLDAVVAALHRDHR